MKSGFGSPPSKLSHRKGLGVCMRENCSEEIITKEDIGCEVKHLNGKHKGYICTICAARPPKSKRFSSDMGKRQGRKGRKRKRSSRWWRHHTDRGWSNQFLW